MNMNQQHSGPSQIDQMKAGASWLAFLSQSLAVSVEVFLHSRIGSRYLGGAGAFVLLIIPVYSTLWEEHDVMPLFQYLIAYLMLCAVVRVGSLRRRFKGTEGHSYYSGYPTLLYLPVLRRFSEPTFKAVIEPMLVFLTGTFVMPANEPLGSYLMMGAAGMFLSVALARSYQRTRMLDMRDAYIAERNVAEQFRRGGWR